MTGTPDKREARSFEPPPWEREQFEEIARRAANKREAAVPGADEVPTASAEEPGAELAASDANSIAQNDGAIPEDIDMMIEALRQEEPETVPGAWKIGLLAAVLTGATGLMLVVFGVMAIARSEGMGSIGVMGSAIMSIMGALFVALAVWVGARSLQQRGVL